ncbi:hypothetical protein GJ496_008041 [Pomphorhynchus laevis]|nr:hypothetical protein GJ496_008041 [Pomphorhynchus laevis]
MDHTQDLLTKEDYRKLREFCEIKKFSIRKADKSSTIVIMKRDDYVWKLNTILQDKTKFKEIQVNEKSFIKKLISTINKIISEINKSQTPADNVANLLKR